MKAIKKWLFKLTLKQISKRIVYSTTPLTPKHLIDLGWVAKQDRELNRTLFFEQGLKDRDVIYIGFDEFGNYGVWHSHKLTFIASESSLEWFEAYYLIIHPNNGRYELAGI